MSRRLHRTVDRWLRAESATTDDSDTGLRRVFQALPAPRLPDGFTDRVMLGAGLELPRRATAPLAWRMALGGALALSAAAAATAPKIAFGLIRQVSAGDILRVVAGAVVETCQRIAEGLAVWQTIDSVGETFAQVLSTPSILAALLAATLLSAGGFRMLHGLLAIDRRSENARA
jgi:hypothetical protein